MKILGDECGHDDLEFIGEQKRDVGVNRYFKCRRCGDVIVVTPGGKAFSVPKV